LNALAINQLQVDTVAQPGATSVLASGALVPEGGELIVVVCKVAVSKLLPSSGHPCNNAPSPDNV